jgi:hypothetical protein
VLVCVCVCVCGAPRRECERLSRTVVVRQEILVSTKVELEVLCNRTVCLVDVALHVVVTSSRAV